MARLIPDLPRTEADGFTPECLVCPAVMPMWPTPTQAQDAAIWHVFDNHPQHWSAVIGDRPPMRPRPTKER